MRKEVVIVGRGEGRLLVTVVGGGGEIVMMVSREIDIVVRGKVVSYCGEGGGS